MKSKYVVALEDTNKNIILKYFDNEQEAKIFEVMHQQDWKINILFLAKIL